MLKGTRIDSGSIIGGGSVISGKVVGHNSLWAGNPSKCLKTRVFWDKSFPDDYSESELTRAKNYKNFLEKNGENPDECNRWIYDFDKNASISWEDIEEKLSTVEAMEKLQYLNEFNEDAGKNRFVHQA